MTVEFGEFVRGEGNGRGAEIFAKALEPARSRNRNDPVLLRDHPGKRNLRGRLSLGLRERLDEFHELHVGFKVFPFEARHVVAEVSGAERRLGTDLAREESLAERTEGNKADSFFFKERENALFGFAPHHRIFALHRRKRADGLGARNRLGTGFGKPPAEDLSFGDQVLHEKRHLFDGHLRVDTVQIIEIDVIGLQTRERPFDRLAKHFGTRVEVLRAGLEVELNAALRRDHDFVADGLQGLAHKRFVRVGPVAFGRVEERDAEVVRLVNEADHFLFRRGGTVAVAHSHAAETDRGHRGTARTEFSLFHCHLHRRSGRLPDRPAFTCLTE